MSIGANTNHTPHAMKSDTPFPGIVCLLGLAVIILLILFCAGCATTTIYCDGKPLARFQGDMSDVVFTRHVNGDMTWQASAVDHSAATVAGGQSLSAFTVPAASVITSTQFSR